MRFFVNVALDKDVSIQAGFVLLKRWAVLKQHFALPEAKQAQSAQASTACGATAVPMPPKQKKEKNKKMLPSLSLRSFYPPIRYAIRSLRIEHIKLSGELGTGDAAQTALLHGLMQSFIYAAFMPKAQDPSVFYFQVEPIFTKPHVNLTFDCMIYLKFGQCIHVIYKLIRAFIQASRA